MKDPQELEDLTEEQIDLNKNQIETILKSLSKNQLTSVKSMILPPMFTFNVLKMVLMIQNPKLVQDQITWVQIKKDLLPSLDIFLRRCQNVKATEIDCDEIEKLEKIFQGTFKSFGENIENKSELYGALIHKMCKFCLRIRIIMHGSKFLRFED